MARSPPAGGPYPGSRRRDPADLLSWPAMLVLALAVVATAAVAAFALRRRRSHRGAGLAPRIDRLPAGVKHLASTVSELSDFGVHLSAARRAALERKPRLGILLGSRQS